MLRHSSIKNLPNSITNALTCYLIVKYYLYINLISLYFILLSVMDLINQVSQLLRAELEELVDMAQAIIEPIKLYNKEW